VTRKARMEWFSLLCNPQKAVPASTTEGRAPSMGMALNVGNSNSKGSGSPMPGGGNAADRAGIGVILALSPDNSLYIHTICPGGSAEGRLLPQDVLVKVGNEDVFCAPPGHVAELLLGPPGSVVELWVRRPKNPNASDLQFTTTCVKVTRKRIDPFRNNSTLGRSGSMDSTAGHRVHAVSQ